MKAQLKEIYSLELSYPIEKFWPEDPHNFGLSLRLIIGLEGGGEESFDMLVCTPDWIKQYMVEQGGIVWGRHMLIVSEYDLSKIKQKVNGYIESCVGNDWMEIAQKLSRIGKWEFEDYRPYQSPK